MATAFRGWRGLSCATLLLAGALSGCSREPALPAPDQIHVVRGLIVQLPEAGKPAQSLQIHHEPIAGWVGPTGKVGMASMVMSFTPAPALSLAGFKVGDVVEFRWEVRRRDKGPSLVTEMKMLPADTPLEFGKASPPPGGG